MPINSRFQTELLRPAKPGSDDSWAFLVLPKNISEQLPRRGRTTVEGTINGYHFQSTLEPDGQLSHWLKVSEALQQAAGVSVGDKVTLDINPVAAEPEPEVPGDLQEALAATPEARAVWEATTTIARLDWIHWIVSAKQAKTRAKRVGDTCNMLAEGKRRVCCFDTSGFYSKAFRAPEAAAHSHGTDS
ncbi:YdeI/OmpD-associated family protein [Microbulbifer bruguierae]|uniref:YdeI/OmpD-associated family protein n=1 Tax=Microbulbifer bruguierae TaxID=3029061 RepID=A0ABY8NAS8_9GAMM|nr:YdeI/OmpD-associated family protein [Microbulbifer bruguierae]WGL16013.1 YdeI/OmpD-associated family protein [Microbulbifer bruguierae]